MALCALGYGFNLEQKDIGQDGFLAKRGIALTTETFDIAGAGHLCVMRMKAFAGLMRMETVIIAPTQVDAPLFNIDWVRVAGKETLVAELYDVSLNPWPDEYAAEFMRIREQYDDLPDSPDPDPHWYDEILYPCSSHKQGRRIGMRLTNMAQDYLASYAALLHTLPACDVEQKTANIRAFAERLYADGGTSVKTITELFGQETAERLIVHCMYGV